MEEKRGNQGYIDWWIERVDLAFARHGIIPMQDPEFTAQDAIERAKRIGTFGKIDRRIQYQGPERARPEVLLEAVNALGNHTRSLQSEKDRMQQELTQVKQRENLKLRNAIIVAVVTAVLSRSPDIVSFLLRSFR